MKKLPLALLLVLSFPLFSQVDYRDGYVILANGDSLTGKLLYRQSSKNYTGCKFKKSDGTVIDYFDKELKAYGYFFDKRFESIDVDPDTDSIALVEVVVRGRMSLFKYYDTLYIQHAERYYTLPFPVSNAVETAAGTRVSKDRRYLGILNFLLSECKLTAPENLSYDQMDVAHLVQNYNRCKGQEGVYYKAKKKSWLINYQAFAGFLNSQLSLEGLEYPKSNLPTLGIGMDISSPKLFDKLFMSIEVLYTTELFQHYYSKEVSGSMRHYEFLIKQSFVKLPIGIRYSLFKDINTPYIKAGGLVGLPSRWEIESTEEIVAQSLVYTEEDKANLKGWIGGFYSSAGYTHSITGRMSLFAEFRLERSYGYVRSFPMDYKNTGLYFLLGVRFR